MSLWVVSAVASTNAGPGRWAVAVITIVAPTIAVAFVLALSRRRLTSATNDSTSESIFGASPEPMVIYDEETLEILDVNRAAIAACGWTREEFLGLTLLDIRIGDEDEIRAAVAALPDSPSYAGEWRHRRKDGSIRWVSVTTQPVTVHGRRARLSVCHDITAQRENEARTKAIVDTAADAILTVDLDGVIESVNPAAERMFGYGADELVGQDAGTLMVDLTDDGSPDGGELVTPDGGESPVAVGQRRGLQLGKEVVGTRRDGRTFPLELMVTEVELGHRTISTVVARDLTERKAFERRLTHQGTHDALTGLPNRTLLMDRLAHALAGFERSARPVAVLFCDLDRFKVVNDSMGHTAGDALLFAVAGRFREAVRGSDTVARFGGDEFVILLEDLATDIDAAVVAEKLAESLAQPIRIAGQELVASASIGIAVASAGASPESLVRDADMAMYRAKANGRARAEVFDSALRHQAQQRLETENALRRATGLREFVVHYQPEVCIVDGRVVGVEALVRWDHPDAGLTAPAAFLPVAEETGLIIEIGEQVFHDACRQAATWHHEFGDKAPIVWVNVSARQLASPRLLEVVQRAVRDLLPTPNVLGLEITETDIVPDNDESRQTMESLRALGIRLAIDDFGTGFASLSYVWRFPAEVVKIDASFVRRIGTERDADELVKAMIQMAHSLGKTTVAEGVENHAQLTLLREMNCDTVQGYLLGRPGTAESIHHLLG